MWLCFPEKSARRTPGHGARSAGVQGDRNLPPVAEGQRPVQRLPVWQHKLQKHRPQFFPETGRARPSLGRPGTSGRCCDRSERPASSGARTPSINAGRRAKVVLEAVAVRVLKVSFSMRHRARPARINCMTFDASMGRSVMRSVVPCRRRRSQYSRKLTSNSKFASFSGTPLQ